MISDSGKSDVMTSDAEQQLSPEQKLQADNLIKQLRCVVCDGQSLAESDADIAIDIKNFVRDEIRKGESPESIKSVLVASYGDTILMEPPLRSDTVILWLLPLLILIVGLVLVARMFKKG